MLEEDFLKPMGLSRFRLAKACRADGIRTVVLIRPGGHNWMFGAQEFREALPRLAESFTATPT